MKKSERKLSGSCPKETLAPAGPPRNPKLAPKHYVEGAKGKFLPHSPEEQEAIMRSCCAGFETDTVVCYCHCCLEGPFSAGRTDSIRPSCSFPDTQLLRRNKGKRTSGSN